MTFSQSAGARAEGEEQDERDRGLRHGEEKKVFAPVKRVTVDATPPLRQVMSE